MKTQTTRNVALGLIGLLALCIYILACTSFSPDDTKILYPAFGDDSGAVGIAVYDREARRSEMLFLPMAFEDSETNTANPRLVRAQWLPDGRSVLLAWPAGKGNDDDGLNLATLPLGASAPLKFFYLPNVKEATMRLMAPLVVTGERVLLCESNGHVARLDLKTGTIARHQLADLKGEVTLYPGLDGRGAFYVAEQSEGPQAHIFGRLNPDNFSQTPLVTITNNLMEGSFFAYSPSGNRVAFVEKAGDLERVIVLKEGKQTFTRPLGPKTEPLSFGSAVLLDNLVVTSFQRKTNGQPRAAYGLMEIPLSDAPVRETILIAATEAHDEADAFYFQMALSHDGKTAAVASTYLACAEEAFKPEDCALFLVNLSEPKRSVTKIPIRLPATRSSPAGK
ncbi:MAG TPA: hypothetical protein VNT26_07430 [Candidatus Sulfotelmatobacter sp.]|nr:hypothetical protein [Candidatus Sulfotelmatobacter sp.]